MLEPAVGATRWTTGRIVALSVAAVVVLWLAARFAEAVPESIGREKQSRLLGACMPMDPTGGNAALGHFPRPAPDFQAQDYTGKLVPLSAYRGKVVMLNFWASWCPPCVQEMPSMDRLARLFATDLVVLAVSSDESWDDIRAFFSGGTAMTVLWDPASAGAEAPTAGALALAYGTEKLPETYLIDRDGNIRFYFVNTRDWSSPAAQRCVRALVEE